MGERPESIADYRATYEDMLGFVPPRVASRFEASAAENPEVLLALNPLYAVSFMLHHGIVGFITLGAVFLAVTGAEALYADLGHFGRKPIQAGWLYFVLPSLLINYFGQGALVLSNPEAIANSFYLMVPKGLQPEKLAVTLDLMAFLLKPEQQALTYDKGYFYPGPAIKDVPLTMAPTAISGSGKLSILGILT